VLREYIGTGEGLQYLFKRRHEIDVALKNIFWTVYHLITENPPGLKNSGR